MKAQIAVPAQPPSSDPSDTPEDITSVEMMDIDAVLGTQAAGEVCNYDEAEIAAILDIQPND